jgi:hypothetical protein
MEQNLPAVGAPVEPTVRPALGYKYHAERVRNTGLHMEATAEFIEAQNDKIEYLFAALQRVRNRIGGSQRGVTKVARDVRDIVDAAMRYEA